MNPDPKRKLTDRDMEPLRMVHRAMMREVDHLVTAIGRLRDGDRKTPARLREWMRFIERTLHHHHRVEDALFFKVLSARDATFQAAHDALEREHEVLNPLLRDVCAGLFRLADAQGAQWKTEWTAVNAKAQELADVLRTHLEHEEAEMIPRSIAHLTRMDVKNVERKALRWIPAADVALIVPWFLTRIDQAEREQMLAKLSMPTRLLNKLWWEPRYRRLAAPVLAA